MITDVVAMALVFGAWTLGCQAVIGVALALAATGFTIAALAHHPPAGQIVVYASVALMLSSIRLGGAADRGLHDY